jgi:hypothetical protein
MNGEKRTKADNLIVQMLECNKMVRLCSDLRDSLNFYRTPLLDYETARMFLRFEKYVEGMYESIMDEFKKKKCEVLNQMTGEKVKYPIKEKK